jgi:CheY-like chemotaxis protein
MAFKPKILVVEDDQPMLHLFGEVLTKMGAEPRLVSSSTHALELIEREKFDGIFLDLVMPEMDGLELARRIRGSKSNATVALVMITASPEPHAMRDSFQAGVNFFLHKPVTVQQLGKLLNAARGLMLAERRRYQRAPVALLMRCRWWAPPVPHAPTVVEGSQAEGSGAEGKNHLVNGRSVNLSASGALVELPELPPVGAAVRLEFSLPGSPQALVLPGVVARQHSAESVGLRFECDDEPTRRALMEFVDKTLASLSSGR